jgi:hypothetical protein
VIGNSGLVLCARILGNQGNPIVQADIATIAYTVQDLTLATLVTSGTFAVATSVFNSLQQQDPRWTTDSEFALGPDRQYGYNFAATVPAAALADLYTTSYNPELVPTVTPHRTQVTVLFTPAAGEVFRVVYQFTPIPTY